MFYQDRGANAGFAKLSNALAKEFPEEKLNQIHDLILGKTTIQETVHFFLFLFTSNITFVTMLNYSLLQDNLNSHFA